MRILKSYQDYPEIHRIFRQFKDEPDAVFLNSSLQNELGRYSIIGLYPYLKLVDGKEFTVNGIAQQSSFEEYVRDYLKQHHDANETHLPIVSGAIGYFSYDYGRKRMGVTSKHEKEGAIPDSILNFYEVFIIEDHQAGTLYLAVNGEKIKVNTRIQELEKKIFAPPVVVRKHKKAENMLSVCQDFSKEDYLKAIHDMINYIVEGDIYIANMTRQLKIIGPRTPFEVFEKLREDNPSPFGGYLNYGDFQVVCASPERFLSMKDGCISTRPIKGTRKRGASEQEDCLLRKELAESQKDQSELLMIVDLERNDLNRVCMPGSVKVKELFAVEEYATVFHLSATIEGKLRGGLTAMDLIEAAFPGGSITGAPKLRAIEVIDELEHSSRNLYTGSIGYLTLDGGMDLNIVIRTVIFQNGCYNLGVGGGITCESELEFEYEETRQKAKAILEAML